MEKKLRRDFKERQKIKEEAKLLGKEYMEADEAGKLKHGDDYRGKIIHEKDRFQDKSQEIAKLKSEIEEREKDLFYADSWEQSGQIRADIEKMKAKLNTLLNSEKGQENGKKSILGAIKEYQAEDKQKSKVKQESSKEAER